MKTFFGTIFLIFTLTSVNAQIQNKNISDTEYDINDPRNPNCPCHKLQEQAEKEYQQYIQKKQTVTQFDIQTQNIEQNKDELKPITSLSTKVENTLHVSTNLKAEPLIKETKELKTMGGVTTLKENKKIKVKKIQRRKNLKIKPFRHSIKSSSLKNARKRVLCFVW